MEEFFLPLAVGSSRVGGYQSRVVYELLTTLQATTHRVRYP